MMNNPQIEIIIPTTGTSLRRQSLLEAIDSVLNQEGVNATPLVVLNGKIFDDDVFEFLKARDDLRLYYQENGSLPEAILTGRNLVEAPYYGFLDDDDILLSGALALKLREFNLYPDTDVVVGNGYIGRFGPGKLMHESLSDSCQERPLTALLVKNWLASCGGLFKNSSVGADFFIDLPKYFEWSWVAFKLCSAKKTVRFLDDATFKVNDTDDSLSKDRENTEAFIDFTARMLEHSKDLGIQNGLKKRLGAAYHAAADQALQEGEQRRAWIYHLRSLNTFSNFKYLSFTRHFF